MGFFWAKSEDLKRSNRGKMSKSNNWKKKKKKEKNRVEQTNNAATKWRKVREVNERRYKSDEDVKFFKQDQVSDKGCFATCFWHLVPGSSCYFAKVKTRNIHVYIGVVAVALEFWTTVPSCVSNHSSNHISCFDSHLCRFPPILFVQDVGQVWIEHRLNSAGEPTISLPKKGISKVGTYICATGSSSWESVRVKHYNMSPCHVLTLFNGNPRF